MKNGKLKKLITLATVVASTFALVACGSSSSDDSKGSDSSAKKDSGTVYRTLDEIKKDGTINIGVFSDKNPFGYVDENGEYQGYDVYFANRIGEDLGVKVNFVSTEAANRIEYLQTGKVDLILANATAALQAAAAGTSEIPILGTSITDYATALDIDNWTGTTGLNISGTSDLAPLDQQAAMLNELFPEAKNVGLLYCSAEPNSKYQATTVKGYLEDLGYTCKEYTFADSNDIASVTTTAAGENDVLYVPTDNTAASNAEIINNICLPAKVPVIAGEEGICSGCGVATLSIDYYDIGYKAGEMGAEILMDGKNVKEMPIEFAPEVTKKYNKANCEALGITVPDDYVAIEE